MKLALILAFALLSTFAFAAPRTMRVDYYHTGSNGHETFAVDRVVLEPLAWPGNPAKNIDESGLGKYYFEVRDKATNRVLHSRGFASIYGEWEQTEEAKHEARTFSESLRFPAPEAPVSVMVFKRDEENVFRPLWTTTVDPKGMFVDSSVPPSPGPLLALQKSGDPATKVDLLILGDGYAVADRAKFEKDARRLMDILFSTSPFKEHRADFNVWGLPGVGGVRDLAAVDRSASPDSGGRDLRRIRERALHPDVRQPGVP